VKDATAAIDRAFGGRQGQLDDFVSALREEFKVDAFKQKEVADRQLKFSLARGGLTGGSAASDAGTKLGGEFQKGLLQGERRSQGALSDLRSADERSKQQLIALAQGGAGVSSSAQNAANALRTNLSGAKARGFSDGLGDIFTETRGLFTRQQEAAERRRGLRESDVFADPFSRG
jgi:hypothetical protein